MAEADTNPRKSSTALRRISGVAGPMGRPDPSESRYEGPWYREAKGLPTKGTAPITQYQEVNKQEALTPKGFVPVTWPTLENQTKRQDKMTDRTLTITITNAINANTKRQVADKKASSRNAQEWFTGGPHVEGDGRRPPQGSG